MADWNNPLITTQYDVFVNEAKDRDVDSATMFLNAPTNPPTGAVKMVRLGSSLVKLQENNAGFADVKLDVAGGGTGAATAALARTNLGIGTMGVQNSNAIAVTGGTIVGLTQLDVSTSITFATDATYDLGTFAKKVRKGYFSDAIVLPVGVDKYATS
jgi:hypothetical protein